MSQYNPHKHHRRSIRLQGYDYSQAGLYFITICCQDRAHLFGEIKNGALFLNSFGEIALENWLATEKIRDNCRIHESIIMPNHVHGIIEILFKKENEENRQEGEIKAEKFKSPSQTIGSIIRGFKIATIKQIKEKILSEEEDRIDSTGELQFAPTAPTEIIKKLDFKIWQRNYYEHIIRDEKAFHNIAAYIINNPKKWNEDKFY